MLQGIPSNYIKVKPQQHRNLSLTQSGEQRLSSVLPYRLTPSKRFSNKDRENQKGVLKVSKQAYKVVKTNEEYRKKEILEKYEETQNYQCIQKNRNKILSRLSAYHSNRKNNSLNYNYLINLYSGVDYSLKRLKEPSLQFLMKKATMLEESRHHHEKLIFLDLDETLIYSNKGKRDLDNNLISFSITIRPYVSTFLEVLSQHYQIYVFTSSMKEYAQAVINRLNKTHRYITDYLCRDSCLQTKKGHYIKDLRIVKNRQLRDIVIVDNLVESFGFQVNNGIPIFPYSGQEDDTELLNLIPFLVDLSKKEDIRSSIRERYQLENLLKISKDDIHAYFMSK